MPALCQGCGKQGPYDDAQRPAWCACTGKSCGPYVAPPGFIGRMIFENSDEAAFRERCGLASNAEREARDRLVRYVRCGRGFRELPRTHPRRKASEAAWRKACRALEALQTICPHTHRNFFHPVACDVCHAHIECNVQEFRHFVRHIGKRAAMRLEI